MADRGDAVGTRTRGRDVEAREDDLEHGEAHEEDHQVPPSPEGDGERHREETQDPQAPLRSDRVELVCQRVQPRRPRRRDEPDDRSVEMIERAGRGVEPDDARDHDDKNGREPKHSGHADLLGQGRRRSGRPALPMMHLRHDHDVFRRRGCSWPPLERRTLHETSKTERSASWFLEPARSAPLRVLFRRPGAGRKSGFDRAPETCGHLGPIRDPLR